MKAMFGGRENGRDEVPFEEYDVKLFELGDLAERRFQEEERMPSEVEIVETAKAIVREIEGEVRYNATCAALAYQFSHEQPERATSFQKAGAEYAAKAREGRLVLLAVPSWDRY